MATWSGMTFRLLGARETKTLLQPPFKERVPSALAVIGNAIKEEVVNPEVGIRFERKANAPHIQLEFKLRALGIFVARELNNNEMDTIRFILDRLEEPEDPVPSDLSKLMEQFLRSGVAAGGEERALAIREGMDLEPLAAERIVPLEDRRAGPMTELIHGEYGGADDAGRENLLDTFIDQLMSLELVGGLLEASRLADLAEQLIGIVEQHQDRLTPILTPAERNRIQSMAAKNKADVEQVFREYLANLVLFKVLRDYHSLDGARYVSQNTRSGFILRTANGSIVGSPPSTQGPRTLHYARMPSRKNQELQTGARTGYLRRDIRIGDPLVSSALTTSAVVEIVLISPDRADLFLKAFQQVAEASSFLSIALPERGR